MRNAHISQTLLKEEGTKIEKSLLTALPEVEVNEFLFFIYFLQDPFDTVDSLLA
jgi:hypothetical protein